MQDIPYALTDLEVGWLAGIFEGEGSAGAYGRSVEAQISMTDRDVIERVQRLFPSPQGVTVRRRLSRHKLMYTWRLRRREDVAAFLRTILPLLAARRTKQARVVLARAEDPGGGVGSGHRNKTHCRNGHLYDVANTHINAKGHRTCRMCRRLQTQARRRRLANVDHNV